MAQNASHEGGSDPSTKKDSALEREVDHVDRLMRPDAEKASEGREGLNNPSQVAQDNRIDKARADARAAGGGPDTPEDGLNQDG